jgi:hypothetical protein
MAAAFLSSSIGQYQPDCNQCARYDRAVQSGPPVLQRWCQDDFTYSVYSLAGLEILFRVFMVCQSQELLELLKSPHASQPLLFSEFHTL